MGRLIGYPVALTKRPAAKWIEAVDLARQRLRAGQEYRETKREDLWKQSEDQYVGEHWGKIPNSDPNADLITVNMSFSTINTIVPYVTASEPNFLVNPYSGDATVRNATIQAALLNRQWRSRKIAGNRHLRHSTEDALMYGDGWMKVGFTVAEKRVSETEYAEIAELWVQRISPWDVWIDPTSDGIHNARWIAHRLLVPKRQLQADKSYKNTHDENINFNSHLGTTVSSTRDDQIRFGQEVFDGSEYAVLYEFTDLVNKTVITFSDGELPLRVVEDIDESMWVQIGNYRIPNSPYHMGELEQLWDLQKELNKTRTHMINHRKRNVQKFLARDGVMDPDAIKALQSSIVNDVAFVKGTDPLDMLIKAADVPALTADVYNVSDIVQRDIYEISGVNEYQRGATPEIRRTATEATIIEGASNIKTQAKLRMVEEAAREAGNLLLGIARDAYPLTDYEELQLFLTGRDAEAIQRVVIGDELAQMMDSGADPMAVQAYRDSFQPGMDAVVSPTPDIFVGEYEVEVEQASTELRNPQMREQKYRQMVEMYVAMAPVLAQMGVQLNMKRFVELHLEAAKVDDVDALFLPGPQVPGMPQMPGMPGQPGPAEGSLPAQVPAAPTEVLSAANTGANPPA